MEEFTSTGKCLSKRGLLFLRDCGQLAVDNCHTCHRPVCSVHRMQDAEGTICPECFARAEKEQTPEKASSRPGHSSLNRHVMRSRYYGRHSYLPFYYGHHHFYSDRDYRTFDETAGDEAAAAAAAAVEGQGDVDDIGDLDDFMES